MVRLAFRNRLSTRDRMRTWGIEQCCMLCGETDETRNHLYFACPYSFTVWMNIAEKLLGKTITPDWDETIASLLLSCCTQIDKVFKRLVFQTVLYVIWRERNSRRYGGNRKSTEAITMNIDKMICN